MLMSKSKSRQLRENINTHSNKLRKAQWIYTVNDKSPETVKLTSEQKRTKIEQNLAKLNYNTEKNQDNFLDKREEAPAYEDNDEVISQINTRKYDPNN